MNNSKSTVVPKIDTNTSQKEDISINEKEECYDFQKVVETDLNFIADCLRFQYEGFFEFE